MISLLWPWMLVLLPLPWLISRAWKGAQTQAGWVLPWVFGGPATTANMATTPVRRPRRTWLFWSAWFALCLAAAQPVRYDQLSGQKATGRDFMLAVDISGSMRYEDMRIGGRLVDRLAAVKAVLGDFVERREGDRLGLILFGQQAFLVTPLTLDRANVRYQLETSVVGLAGLDTAIGDALALAVKRLRERPASQRIVLLLTDGVNSAGEISPERATELAVELGVRVYTIGFGGDGEQDFFGLSLGRPNSEIDEVALQRMADATGGKYFRARDVGELAGIYQTLDTLEPIEFDAPELQLRRALFAFPLGAALLLLCCGLYSPHAALTQRPATSTGRP